MTWGEVVFALIAVAAIVVSQWRLERASRIARDALDGMRRQYDRAERARDALGRWYCDARNPHRDAVLSDWCLDNLPYERRERREGPYREVPR